MVSKLEKDSPKDDLEDGHCWCWKDLVKLQVLKIHMNDPGKLRTSASNNACVKRKQKGLLIIVKRIKFAEVVKMQGRCYKRQKNINDQQKLFKQHKSLLA